MGLRRLIEEKKRKQRRKTTTKIIATSTVATAVGVLGGILLAPKSGKETRADIKEKTGQASEQIKSKSIELKNNLTESKNKIKEYLENKRASAMLEEEEPAVAVEVSENIEANNEIEDTKEVQEVI